MVQRDLKICEKCNLSSDTRIRKPCISGQYSKPMLHKNDKTCNVMVVVESPCQQDEIIGSVFSDEKPGVFLREALEGAEIPDYYITNIVKCVNLDPKGKNTIPPTPAIIKSCQKYFKQEMEIVQPKYVLLLGNSALIGALRHSGIGKFRGTPDTRDGVTYLATYNPEALFHNTKYINPFLEDMKIFEAIVKSEGDMSVYRKPVTYHYVNTMEMVKQLFAELIEAKLFSFDIEAPSLNAWKTRYWTVEVKDQPISPYAEAPFSGVQPYSIVSKANNKFELNFMSPPAVLCVSFSTKEYTSWVLPLDHPQTPFSPAELVKIKSALKVIMEREDILKIAHNAKYDIKYIKVVLGIDTKGLIFDTMLASYLLNEEGGEHGLKDLALRHTDLGNYEDKLDEVRKLIKPKSEEYNYSLISMTSLFPYAACDADATIRLYHILKALIEAEELLDAMSLMVMICLSVLDVEFNGANINIEYAKRMAIEYAEKIESMKKAMRSMGEIQDIENYYSLRNALSDMRDGYTKDLERRTKQGSLFSLFPDKLMGMPIDVFFKELDKSSIKDRIDILQKLYTNNPELFRGIRQEYFNFNSTYHLQDLIYGYLGAKVNKRTATNSPSTDEEVINSLSTQYTIMETISKYKKLVKFHSTYLAPVISDWLCDDKLIHSNYKIHGTATGRLSSTEPNMQNLPRDDKVVKSMFISRFENGFIVNADYSQIELRVLAIYSMDAKLIEFYNSGKDLHSQTAATILKKPFEEVTGDERQIFKSINFLIVYGGTPRALALKTGITEEQAQGFMDEYFIEFPGIVDYMHRFRNFAMSNKFIRTLSGRKRRLYNVDSDKEYIKEEALRMAINTPIQSTASDITQTSMARVQKVFKQANLKSLVIGTVHDSLIFDVHPSEVFNVYTIIKTVMENPPYSWCRGEDGNYIVPYKCDISIGKSYGATKDLTMEENNLYVNYKVKKLDADGNPVIGIDGKEEIEKKKVLFQEYQW